MLTRLAWTGFVLIGLLFTACENAPTKAYETKEIRDAKTEQALRPETILIDARPPFVSALARPNGSLQLQWEDFTQREAPFEGRLENDLFPQARRLARMGIGPDTDLLILGRGKSGEGEEGRLAWTLKRMGLQKVRFASLESIKWPSTSEQAPERAEVPIWKPQMNEDLEITRSQALGLIKKGANDFWVLDVRVNAEFSRDPEPFVKLKLKPRFEHLAWTEFFDEKGDFAPKLRYKLEALGIKTTDQIAVIDERGVGAGGVVLRLHELGFTRARLWAGGYRELRAFPAR